MKVLFQTYSLAHQNPGGGERVISHLARELKQLGVEVTLRDPWRDHPLDFDLIHYFSTLESAHWTYWKTHYPQVPLAVTPTLYLGSRTHRFARYREQLGATLGIFANKRWRDLQSVDHLFPTTEEEKESIHSYFGIPLAKMTVLENGIASIFGTVNEKEFREFSRIEGDYVLHVGRFDPVKNQNFLIEALKDLDLTCVFIGNPDPQYQKYFDQLKASAEASKRAKFLFFPGIESDSTLLASAYSGAKVFAMPSQFETFGLAAVEAMVSGCSLVLSEGMVAKKVFSSAKFLPLDPSLWREEIEKRLKESRPAKVQIEKSFHWKKIAQRLKQQYEILLKMS